MQITNFTINTDKTEIDVTITDAATITELRLWKNFDYKDFSLAVDLSGKLTASATETLTITLADIGETCFDGVYYLQADDPDEISIKVTADLTRFKECIIPKIINANLGKPCLVQNNIEVINAHAILVNLAYAVELQFIDEIIELLDAINVYCSDECKSCGGYKDLADYEYRVFNDPNFIIDGGNII
jgi:hypothetical protein